VSVECKLPFSACRTARSGIRYGYDPMDRHRWYNGNRSWVPAVVEEMIAVLKREDYIIGAGVLID